MYNMRKIQVFLTSDAPKAIEDLQNQPLKQHFKKVWWWTLGELKIMQLTTYIHIHSWKAI